MPPSPTLPPLPTALPAGPFRTITYAPRAVPPLDLAYISSQQGGIQATYVPTTAAPNDPGLIFVPPAIPDDPRLGAAARAFWRYWVARTHGEATISTADYPAVMFGDELVRAEEAVARLRAEGQGRRTDIDDPKLFAIALLADRIELYAEFGTIVTHVDPASGRLIGRYPERSEATTGFFTLVAIGDVWQTARADVRIS